jgi:hypothetical protein
VLYGITSVIPVPRDDKQHVKKRGYPIEYPLFYNAKS